MFQGDRDDAGHRQHHEKNLEYAPDDESNLFEMCLAGQAQAHKAYLRRASLLPVQDQQPSGLFPKWPGGRVASISCSRAFHWASTTIGPSASVARHPMYVAIQQPKHIRIETFSTFAACSTVRTSSGSPADASSCFKTSIILLCALRELDGRPALGRISS
jgi:hypothetical protein